MSPLVAMSVSVPTIITAIIIVVIRVSVTISKTISIVRVVISTPRAKERIVEFDEGAVIADTGVKLMGKLHQIFSGTVLTEDGDHIILDDTKAQFIKEHFKGKKIGIFYKFKSEWLMLKKVFGDDITDDLTEFTSSDKNIALQMVSGREGISLKDAEYLVFINIDFSAVTYFQAKDRMTTKDRKFNKIFWIFAENGIEAYIYKAVSNKKDFTLRLFKNVFSL